MATYSARKKNTGKLYNREVFSLAGKLPSNFEWKVFSKLIHELKPQGLIESFSDEVEQCIRTRDSLQLKKLSITWGPQSMSSNGYTTHEIALVYQCLSFIKKYPFGSADEKTARIESALEKLNSAEDQCRKTNDSARRFSFPDDDHYVGILEDARAFIRKVLPKDIVLDDIYKKAKFGKGQSFCGPSGGKITKFFKFSDPSHWTVTQEALPYAEQMIRSDERWLQAMEYYFRGLRKDSCMQYVSTSKPFAGPLPGNWLRRLLKVVPGNRVTFVPKDAQTERPIAIEPGLNLMLQLGVESIIRQGLKSSNINLDCQLRNQQLAEEASKTGEFATIDLSNASDTVSMSIVKALLPEDWFLLISDLRCQTGTYKEHSWTYEKVSSMGNGFTFALESLIFSALTFACYQYAGDPWTKDSVAVFGDDIVCTRSSALVLTELLTYCGFSINNEKSFYVGLFRESCGADYVNGCNIRPIFHKSTVNSVPDLFVLYNNIYLWLEEWLYSHDDSLTLQYILKYIPEELKLFGPANAEEKHKYLFSPLPPKTCNGVSHWREISLVPKVKKEALYKDFYFQKLMASLPVNDDTPLENGYLNDWRDVHVGKELRTFDITRRDAFDYVVTRRKLPQWLLKTSK